ncbi:hypothetical protein RvY_12466-2 [Ramazzottius varieornatus]|uniref:EF-hand domain-containing protein n=1 Tax=Ramazzottius varieornatus TaxID=947166 RepID=A0A1D1VQ18_RAMVA|nr:hypothetical protein RvY_12466-2 [Ramazzottius varieornatus]
MNGLRDVFGRVLKSRRSTAYLFADGQQPEVTQEGVDCELVALDPQGRRVGIGPRPPLVRSGTQMSLDKLQVSSKFNRKEIDQLYREFKYECPHGYMTKDQFHRMYQKFFPFGNCKRYARYVFETFESDKHGHVSFQSFLLGMSILSRGDTNEKLRWIFNLYDIDKNGCITQDEITEIVSAVHEMRASSRAGNDISESEPSTSAQGLATRRESGQSIAEQATAVFRVRQS